MNITKRPLHNPEIALLCQELHKFSEIGWLSPSGWKQFGPAYVATIGNRFVGVCNVVKLNGWTKIGPLVIIEKYQGKGLGKALLSFVVKNLQGDNLFIGSSNSKVVGITRGLKFKETVFWSLPTVIKLYLFRYFLDRLNIMFLVDAFRKRLHTRNQYYYFIKAKYAEHARIKIVSCACW